MRPFDKDERIDQRRQGYKKQANITLTRQAIEFVAKQIVMNRMSREALRQVRRGDRRAINELDREAYSVANKLDQSKLNHKQKNLIMHRMTTLGHFALWELMDIENALLGAPSVPQLLVRSSDGR